MRSGITAAIACHPARMESGMLTRAFTSVAAQTLQPAAVVVVNDLERRGAGTSRRLLLDMVDTEWLAWLDSDDEWKPEHLERLHQVAADTGAVFVYSWFEARSDPLGHFGKPFNPCQPHHTTITHLVRTDIAREVGFYDNDEGPYANEDWKFITGVARIACERELRMIHLAERTWTWHMGAQNSSGQPGQGDAT